MDSLLVWAQSHDWWVYVSSVVTVSTAVMAIMPSTIKGAGWYNIVMKGLNLLAGNVGKNKSKDDKTKIAVTEG